MDKFLKKRRAKLLVAILLSIGLPLGIGMTVGGAIKAMWLVMGIGIALIVAGFYGAPVAWTTLSNDSKMLRLISAVEEKNLYTVSELANYINANQKVVVNLIRQAIDKGYITDYLFVDDDRLELIKSRKQEFNVISFKCDNCGAIVKAHQKDATAQCEYCGKIFGSDYIDRTKI